MNSRVTTAIAGLAVGAAAVATPAFAAATASAGTTGGPTASCPKPATSSATFEGVVTRPESPSTNQPRPTTTPTSSPSTSPSSDTGTATISPSDTATATISPSDTATATVSPSASSTAKPTPASSRTLEIRVAKVRRGSSGMNRHTYTVVDCTHSTATSHIKRNDKVTVTAYRVHGDSHRLYATSIVDNGPATKPKPKPTATAHSTR